MFSRNKSNQCFNIESVSRKKIVNVQRDNDIFNRYASLSRKGVVFRKEDFSFKPDKSLKNEIVSMIYDNSHHSRNTKAQSVKKENSCDIIFYDRTHNYFYNKNKELPTDNKNKNKKILNKSCEIGTKEPNQKTKQKRFKNKRSSSIVINEEIAQYDLNERSKLYIKTNIENKIYQRELLSKKASDVLIATRRNPKKELAETMSASQSMSDIRHWNNKKKEVKQIPIRAGIYTRKPILDYYEMNDKFIKDKNRIYSKRENQSTFFKEYKEMSLKAKKSDYRKDAKDDKGNYTSRVIHPKPFLI